MDFEIVFEFFESIKESSQAPRIPQSLPQSLAQVQVGSTIFILVSLVGQKIVQKFDVILVSFLTPLGSLLASLLDPLGRPNRSKSLQNAS